MELMKNATLGQLVKPLKGFKGYFITIEGEILKQEKNGKFKKIQGFATKKNEWRVNLKGDDGKYTTKQVHTLVYGGFKLDFNYDEKYFNKTENKIIFLDDDFKNCSLNNLITVKELKEFYLKNKS